MKFLAVGLSLGSLVWAAEPEPSLLGRWRSVETSRGAIGVVVEFQPGQNYKWSPSPIVSSTYQRSGDQLTLEVADPKGRSSRVNYRIEKLVERELVLALEKQRIELRRTGPVADAKNLLLGGWTGPYPLQGVEVDQFLYFYPDGTQLFTLPIRWQIGQYSIRNGQITMTQLGQQSRQGPMTLNGNELTIPWARDGRPTKFLRY
jgi:hypothetical protein